MMGSLLSFTFCPSILRPWLSCWMRAMPVISLAASERAWCCISSSQGSICTIAPFLGFTASAVRFAIVVRSLSLLGEGQLRRLEQLHARHHHPVVDPVEDGLARQAPLENVQRLVLQHPRVQLVPAAVLQIDLRIALEDQGAGADLSLGSFELGLGEGVDDVIGE